ncbi:MAG TPA: VIT family protein [Stellaceae bacterium]|jgi:VIT1/CCC1 family predicted Fe2+/Mn2+ transporter|nr:VIT family protein [Stellaceae bacterium]
MAHRHRPEFHMTERLGWLRAAVLGANDGILSTASLLIGVASANVGQGGVLLAGLSGMVAGAMSMAAGEYVSVSSQADSEHADIAREKMELEQDRDSELRELAGIYIQRGLSKPLALEVAQQLMEHDALGAHARDELGISPATSARPVQAALASAASFASGAALPMLVAFLTPRAALGWAVGLTSLICLALLGFTGAKAGGARPIKAAVRVVFWGALAMAVTAGVGTLFGTYPG